MGAALDIVSAKARRANQVYVQAFTDGDRWLAEAGILANRLRLAHFLAQCFHETGYLTILVENMRYTAPRIRQVWPSRPAAAAFAGDPEGLANCVYGGRMGNVRPGDGWRYIGRGLVQCTGFESYDAFGRELGIPLADQPALAIDPMWTLRIAISEWTEKRLNEVADRNDLVTISRRINGGTIGLDDRREAFGDIWPLMLKERDDAFVAAWGVVSGGQEAWTVAVPHAEGDHSSLALQKALNTLLGAHLTEDGLAGPATRSAVTAFQRAHKLSADGIAGPATWAAIDKALAA